MGCDIHIVVERRMKGRSKWTGLYSTDVAYPIIRRKMVAAQRDYGFFAEVACVRGRTDTSKYPRNLPEDMSDLSREQFWTAPTDYHSPSHMTPKEFVEAWLRADAGRNKDVRPDYAMYDLLGIESDDDHEYRVVFWFDN